MLLIWGCISTIQDHVTLIHLHTHSIYLTREFYRLAKAGHPETLNAGLHMISGSIPMFKGMVAKMMEDDHAPDRIAEVQAELAQEIESMLGVCPMYIPWTVTVGRKPKAALSHRISECIIT